MSDKRLLVVDDEPEIGEFIREVAEEMGYEVVVTQAASAFKKACDTFGPTVIMVDIVMPEIDGIELLRYLAEKGCEARVLVMSGYSEKYLNSAEKLSGAYGLRTIDRLTKPIRLAQLRKALGG
jgi:CheY-like chemotaxis protein